MNGNLKAQLNQKTRQISVQKSNKSWVYTPQLHTLEEESKVALNVLFTAFR